MRDATPIPAAYEESGSLHRVCPMCAAPAGEWCTDSRGRVRRVPCVLRPTRSSDVDPPTAKRNASGAVDFGEPRRPTPDDIADRLW